MNALLLILLLLTASLAARAEDAPGNRYRNTVLVANQAKYKPVIAQDKGMVNAWGIATRPMGKGGHFWVVGDKTSFEYVGDVQASPNSTLRTLHTDALAYVTIPVGGKENVGTGVAFSDSADHFVVMNKLQNGESVIAPAKFIFASDGGVISAWTEQKRADGSMARAPEASTVINRSEQGSQFFGVAVSSKYHRLYVADFGADPALRVYDGQFNPEPNIFATPFDENRNGRVDAGEYAPFNVQQFDGRVFIAYAKTQACPFAEVANKNCAEGELFVGEEDTSQPGYGRLAEFDEDGRLIAVWNDGGKLSAPWGMAFAPKDFGRLSGMLLVANFGDGTIAAYDPATREFVDVMRDAGGKPVAIDKIWGLVFGNGESLGDSNALYYTAGPDEEKDGVFGSLRAVK